MFNIVRDFYGNGFTIAHHGSVEHFSNTGGDSWQGDFGSYVYKDWAAPGSYKGHLVDPSEEFAGMGSFFVTVALSVAFVTFCTIQSAALMLTPIVYLLLAVGINRNKSDWAFISSMFFVGLSFYQTVFAFIKKNDARDVIIATIVLLFVYVLVLGLRACEGMSEALLCITILIALAGCIMLGVQAVFINKSGIGFEKNSLT